MKADITVRQLIDVLKTLEQDAKVCISHMQDDGQGFYYTAIEGSRVMDSEEYIRHNGEVRINKVVGFY